MHSIEKNSINCVKALLGHDNVDINARNHKLQTALMIAVIRDRAQCARLLLTHPLVDINAMDKVCLFFFYFCLLLNSILLNQNRMGIQHCTLAAITIAVQGFHMYGGFSICV